MREHFCWLSALLRKCRSCLGLGGRNRGALAAFCRRVSTATIVLWAAVGPSCFLYGQTPSAAEAPRIATAEAKTDGHAPPTHYLGRQIANTMHYSGAEWLVRESRQREEDCKRLLAALNVKQGQTICDLGCGNGFYTVRLARLVGPKGKVFAVDIQPEMLDMLKQWTKKERLTNVIPILGAVDDPRLPEGQIDLVLMVDVYHELSYPEQMLAAVRKSLKPGGRVALAEFRAEDPNVPILPLHKMSKKQILKELSANRFCLVEQFDGLPWQHLMFFKACAADGG